MRKTLLMASVAATAVLALAGAADAAPFDWSGFYAGAHLGYLFGDVTLDESGTKGGAISGPIGGAIFGYNFAQSPLSNVVFGLEADAGIAGVSGHGLIDGCADYLYDLNWDAHVRARAGFPMGNMMPFVAAGLAVADLDISNVCDEVYGGTFTGGTVGGGVDFKVAPRTIARGEVLYDFYGNHQYEDFSASFNAWTARAAILIQLP